MTPTLSGRWQTRYFTLLIIGVPITAIFHLLFSIPFGFAGASVVWLLLISVGFWGFFWDIFYNLIIKFRWDHDWPPAYQWAAGITEGFFVWILFNLVGLLFNLPYFRVPLWAFILHYFTVFTWIFIVTQSLMRILFVRWRFSGGQLIRQLPR